MAVIKIEVPEGMKEEDYPTLLRLVADECLATFEGGEEGGYVEFNGANVDWTLHPYQNIDD